MDLFGGTVDTLNQLVRLRVASVDLDWKNTTLSVGQDKPMMAPREPESLAQVGVSPLTGAGNLWLWQPQVRVEQRFRVGEQRGFARAGGCFSNQREPAPGFGAEYRDTTGAPPPRLRRRGLEFWRSSGRRAASKSRPAFTAAHTHVAGLSAASRIFSVDWLIRPAAQVRFHGRVLQRKERGRSRSAAARRPVFPDHTVRVHRGHGGLGTAHVSRHAAPVVQHLRRAGGRSRIRICCRATSPRTWCTRVT